MFYYNTAFYRLAIYTSLVIKMKVSNDPMSDKPILYQIHDLFCIEHLQLWINLMSATSKNVFTSAVIDIRPNLCLHLSAYCTKSLSICLLWNNMHKNNSLEIWCICHCFELNVPSSCDGHCNYCLPYLIYNIWMRCNSCVIIKL